MYSRLNGVPAINKEENTVCITFFVVRDKRTDHKQIDFQGHERSKHSAFKL